METDVPKDWNRERGGLSRNHKGFQGKSGRTERVRARQRAAGRGCSEAGRGKKWEKKVAGPGGGGGRGVREESGAGRGAGPRAWGAGRRPGRRRGRTGSGRRSASASKFLGLAPGPGAACCRREERSGARQPETRNLASRARRGAARREEAAGRRRGPELPRRFGEHRAGGGEGRRPGRDGLPGDGAALKALC